MAIKMRVRKDKNMYLGQEREIVLSSNKEWLYWKGTRIIGRDARSLKHGVQAVNLVHDTMLCKAGGDFFYDSLRIDGLWQSWIHGALISLLSTFAYILTCLGNDTLSLCPVCKSSGVKGLWVYCLLLQCWLTKATAIFFLCSVCSRDCTFHTET